MTHEQNTPPEEASAAMRQFARHLRDMHVALLAEGFTETEVLAMLGQVISAAVASSPRR